MEKSLSTTSCMAMYQQWGPVVAGIVDKNSATNTTYYRSERTCIAGRRPDYPGYVAPSVIKLADEKSYYKDVFLVVRFQSGVPNIADPVITAKINELALFMSSFPASRVRIEGHTDGRGTDAANLALSKRRAQSVANFFRWKGIAPQRMTIHGYGERRPIATNDTEEGRAQNRRVDITIIERQSE